ncbi:MAG: hypothetical protein Kow0062_24330 [Acidobacteriota bacterium]
MNVHVDPYVQRMVRGLARRRQGILALQLFVWLWLALVPFHEAWAPHSQLEVFFGIRTLVFVALIPVAYLLVAPDARSVSATSACPRSSHRPGGGRSRPPAGGAPLSPSPWASRAARAGSTAP